MRRSYKEAWPLAQALNQIRADAGLHFDPQVANCFMDIQRKIVGIGSDWPQREEQNREFKLAT